MRSISSKVIANEAKKMWFRVKELDKDYDIFKVYFGDRTSCLFKNIDCGLNVWIWTRFAMDKRLTYALLKLKNIKIPNSIILEKDKISTFDLSSLTLKYPLVIKPCKWSHWDGVIVNIKNEAELLEWLKIASTYDQDIIVQEFFKWEDFRIIVINHKFVAATKRIPAHVVGDGNHTIRDLVDIENSNEKRGDWHEKPLTRMTIDDEAINYIKEQWFTLDDIPEKWKVIFIRKNANVSTWWLSVDVTDIIHPEIKKLCEKVSKIINLKVCWVDYISEDISKPLKYQKWGIIEVNDTPGIYIHHLPAIWKPRNVAKKILELAYKTYHW